MRRPVVAAVAALSLVSMSHGTALAEPVPHPSRSAPSAAVKFLRCVIAHESGGNPRAENPHSSASGLFQMIDSTFRHYAKAVPEARPYRHAADAPSRVQWLVALKAVAWQGHMHWKGTHCGYGT